MTRSHPTSTRLGLAGLLALTLAACGGGGGGGAGSPPPPNVAVTATNQDAVTRAGFAGIVTGTLSGSLGIAGGPSSPMNLSGSALKRVLSATAAFRKRIAADVSADLCPGGGSASATVNDTAPIGTLNPNDSASITFSNCNVGGGVLVSGNMGVVYTTVTASALGANISADGLVVSEASTGYSASMDGGFSLTLSGTTSTLVAEMVVPNQLVMSSAHVGTIIDTITLLDGYTVLSTYESTTATTTSTATGPIASAAAGGFVRIATPTPLVQFDTETYPHTGVLEATGLTGQLRATVRSNTQVRIDLDVGGDGTYEANKTVLWTTLL